MQTPQALLDRCLLFISKESDHAREGEEANRCQHSAVRKTVAWRFPITPLNASPAACCPWIQAYYESDEGQAELAAWNEKRDAEDTREQDRKTA